MKSVDEVGKRKDFFFLRSVLQNSFGAVQVTRHAKHESLLALFDIAAQFLHLGESSEGSGPESTLDALKQRQKLVAKREVWKRLYAPWM